VSVPPQSGEGASSCIVDFARVRLDEIKLRTHPFRRDGICTAFVVGEDLALLVLNRCGEFCSLSEAIGVEDQSQLTKTVPQWSGACRILVPDAAVVSVLAGLDL
jgi:hypothetical protein